MNYSQNAPLTEALNPVVIALTEELTIRTVERDASENRQIELRQERDALLADKRRLDFAEAGGASMIVSENFSGNIDHYEVDLTRANLDSWINKAGAFSNVPADSDELESIRRDFAPALEAVREALGTTVPNWMLCRFTNARFHLHKFCEQHPEVCAGGGAE